jgi:glycine betaine catabolism B
MKFETRIKEIIPRTYDVTSFRFNRPQDFDYKPGQYILVTIKGDTKELTKPFTISTSPTEATVIEFTKKLTDHEYSMALKSKKIDDWARIDGPYGKLTFEGEYPKIALLAGGIGITPFRSICKYAADKQLNAKITLFYACSTEEDMIFKEDFATMAAQNKNFRAILTLSQATPQWTGMKGRITADLIKQQLPDYQEHIFFACGPPPMVKAMETLVESLGLLKSQFKQEQLTGY